MIGRRFCCGLLAATLSMGLGMASAADETIQLKVSHYLPESHGIHRDFIEPWARRLEEKTDGQVQVKIHAGGSSFGNITRQLEQVRAGVVDISLGLSGLPRGRFPATSVIEMPFLVETADAGTRTLWDLYKEGHLKGEYEGLKPLALFTHNAGLIHTTDRPVRTMEDMEGLRLRTPSVPISQMLEYLDASPVGMPPSQVYENLQKGTLDGVVFTWDAVGAFRLNEVLKYHTDARSYVVSFYFVMNQRKYDSLPPEVQDAIDSVSGDALIPRFGEWWNKWDAAGREDAVERGHEIIKLSDEERARWREALQPMIQARLDELEEAGVDDARAIYQRAQELVDKYED
ncbi:TRAP transporter substrate-binding protein [Ectothiorhodospiraceae bacterium WFHF3C12]|nr:TRAP transporter substrate-binding protein [Ectothiorhodospiraceae bacterium WFHF3C12]